MTFRSLAPFLMQALLGFGNLAFAGGSIIETPECTTDFKAASAMFQSVLGADAPIGNIPKFSGSFKTPLGSMKTENEIVQSGDQVFLNTQLAMLSADISSPVRVCREGNRLTATLIMSAAKLKNKAGTSSLKQKFKEVPNEIVIHISRPADTKQVVFHTETFKNEPATAVTLR